MNKIQKIQARNLISAWFLVIWAALFLFCLWNPRINPGVRYSYHPTHEYYELRDKERKASFQRWWDAIGNRGIDMKERVDMIRVDMIRVDMILEEPTEEDREFELKNNPRYFQKFSHTTYYRLLPTNDATALYLLIITLLLFCEFGVLRNMTSDELEVLRNISSESKIDKKPLRGISHLASVERKIKENKAKDEKTR